MISQTIKKIDSRLKNITLFVLAAHFAAVVVAFFQFHTPPKVIRKEVLVVKTIELGGTPSAVIQEKPKKPEKKKEIAQPAKPVAKVEEVSEPPKPQPKQEKKKEPEKVAEVKKEKVVVKKEPAKPKPAEKIKEKPVAQKTTPKKVEKKKEKVTTAPKTTPKQENAVDKAKIEKQQALLKKAKESMAKIDKNVVDVGSTVPVTFRKPGKIEKLQIEGLPTANSSKAVFSENESSYHEELASRLKLFLRLPDYGEVKIKLTLERSGKVGKVAIVSAKSVQNKKYIEDTVPGLSFPAFGDNFSGQSQYTFVISLSNE